MTIFVCAHGAGGHKDDRGMLALANALAPHMDVVRFNFPYREKGAKIPDRMPVLKESIASAVEKVRGKNKLLIGGRSMGGRAASMLAADGFPCDGLLLFAYPLHPAGKPEKLRDAHLAQIGVPVLCINGTRDELCRRDLMEKALEKLSWRMHWLEGATHSFRARDYPEIAAVTAEWLSGL